MLQHHLESALYPTPYQLAVIFYFKLYVNMILNLHFGINFKITVRHLNFIFIGKQAKAICLWLVQIFDSVLVNVGYILDTHHLNRNALICITWRCFQRWVWMGRNTVIAKTGEISKYLNRYPKKHHQLIQIKTLWLVWELNLHTTDYYRVQVTLCRIIKLQLKIWVHWIHLKNL